MNTSYLKEKIPFMIWEPPVYYIPSRTANLLISLVNSRQNHQIPIILKVECLCVSNRTVPHFSLGKSISKISKAIPRPPSFSTRHELNSVILPSRLANRFGEVESCPTIYCNDLTVCCPAFVPTAAVAHPNCTLEIFLDMLIVVCVCFCGDFKCSDGFGLELCDDVVEIDGDRLDPQYK